MVDLLQFIINSLCVSAIILLYERQRRQIREIYKDIAEEREELLDRIMANNIHEYKSASGQSPTIRSENNNYLVDRMKKTIKNQFSDLD